MGTRYAGTPEERRALDLYIKLMRASDAVAARTNGPMAAAGLSPSQFGVLETLYHHGPLMLCQLAEKHLKSRNNLTTVVDNLERDGLAQRVRDQSDRRVVMVHLTEAGRERITAALVGFVRGVVADLSVLAADEQALLDGLLRRLGRRDSPADPAGESAMQAAGAAAGGGSTAVANRPAG